MRVQALVTKLAIEALYVPVLHGFSGLNVVYLQVLPFAPSAHGVTNESRPVIYTNGIGQAAFFRMSG